MQTEKQTGLEQLMTSLNTCKIFYIGTSDELKERVPSSYEGIIVAEAAISTITIGRLLFTHKFDKYSIMAIPFMVDFGSRFYRAIKEGLDIPPEHTPNLIGQLRERYK